MTGGGGGRGAEEVSRGIMPKHRANVQREQLPKATGGTGALLALKIQT